MNRRINLMLMAALFAATMLVVGGCSSGSAPVTDTPGPDTAVASKPKTQPKPKPQVTEETITPKAATTSSDANADRGDMVTGDTATTAASSEGLASLLKTIYFDFDKSDITSDAAATLDANKDNLLAYPAARIRIEGHCDERGTNEYNLALGERRANATKRYMADAGVDPNRMDTISYGEERPVDPASNEAAWAKNRRAEFRVVE